MVLLNAGAALATSYTPTNLALHKSAYSSSALDHPFCYGQKCKPSFAVDGDTTSPPRILHTEEHDHDRWLSVDLGQTAFITEIVIYHRIDCCTHRMRNAEVRVGNTSIMTTADTPYITANALVWRQEEHTVYGNGAVTRIRLPSPVVGRWVSIQNLNPDHDLEEAVLQVAELQVFGVYLTNVACGKPAYASSVYTGYCEGDSCKPGYAVDGDATDDRKMFHSATGDSDPWVSIDLGCTHLVSEIRIYHRTMGASRTRFAELRFGNASVRNPGDTHLLPANGLVWKQPAFEVLPDGGAVTRVVLTQPLFGRWVTLQNQNPTYTADPDSSALQVLEITVFGAAASDLMAPQMPSPRPSPRPPPRPSPHHRRLMRSQ